jgi:hypothetical protein
MEGHDHVDASRCLKERGLGIKQHGCQYMKSREGRERPTESKMEELLAF